MRVEVCSIKDLPKTPNRMGLTCANLNGELFFIWGGTDLNVAYLPTDNCDLWIYETLTGYFRYRCCTGECPPYVSGATSVLIGQKMYVFGGFSTLLDNWLNGLHCLDLEHFVWKDLSSLSRGEPTKPIRSDKCVSWAYDGKMYVFGGYGWSQTEHILQLEDRQKDLQLVPDYRWPKLGWNNQLVEFDPRDNTWRWPAYTGKCPSARAAHTGSLMGSKYYLFGGRDSRERLNDLYTLDMKTFEWNQIAVFSLNPAQQPITRPIRHLLEEEDDEDNQQQFDDNEDDDENEEVENYIDDLVVEELPLEETLDEQLTPSPYSSFQQYQQTTNAQPHSQASSSTANFNDNDEDEDFLLEYPHPSHLLERLSLCSHRSTSSLSNITNTECLVESSPSTTNNTNDGNHLIMNPQNAQHLISENDTFPIQNNLLQPLDQSTHHNQQQHQLEHPSEQHDVNESDATNLLSQTFDKVLPQPIGRSFCSFTQISDKELMLYGGVSSQDENLHDCWIFNIIHNSWTQLDLRSNKHPRLWHTAACTKNNEVVIIGGSPTEKVDDISNELLTISMEPKSLKKLSLDAVAKSIKMRTLTRAQHLPSTIVKLIRLRKQAIALTMRRGPNHSR